MLGRYQFSLKSALATVFCLCVGLAATTRSLQQQPGTNWISDTDWFWLIYNVCLFAVAVGIIIGLMQQVLALQRSMSSSPSRSHALTFALVWRILFAIILASSIVLTIGRTQGLVTYPEDGPYFGFYSSVIPNSLLFLCVIVALLATPNRASALSAPSLPRYLKKLLFVVLCIILVVGALAEELLTTHLTYQALSGVEASQVSQFRRPGAYVDQQSVSYRFIWLAGASLVAFLLGATTWLWSIRTRIWSLRIRILMSLVGLLFVSLAAGYGYWFLMEGYPRLAPDFAEAGLQSDRRHWLEAVLLLSVAIPVAAYRIVRNPCESLQLEDLDRVQVPFFHLDLPMLGIGALGGLCYLLTLPTLIFDQTFPNFTIANNLWWLVTDLNIYLSMATASLCLSLFWKGMRSRLATRTICVQSIDYSRFTLAIIALVLLTIVGIPTIMAFSFSIWIIPWFSY